MKGGKGEQRLSFDIFAKLREGISESGSRIVMDLLALPDDRVAVSPGGNARSAADFVYEVAFVNRRMAARLRGETPAPASIDGWIVAPPEFQQKPALAAEVEASVEELIAALDTHTPDGIEHPVKFGDADWTVFDAALFIARHMNYHDAQLNYLQAFYGDMDVHW